MHRREKSGSGQDAAEGDSRRGVVPESNEVGNGALLRWMFQFIKPVKLYAIITLAWVIAVVIVEARTVDQAGRAFNAVQDLPADYRFEGGLLDWFTGSDSLAAEVVRAIGTLLLLALGMLVSRYMLEMARARWSMNMVFHIRQAVYDKLQRVGFAFHDSVPTGQLINRALSDLQHVRMFIQNSLLQSIEIVLSVVAYMTLILTKSPWLALLAIVPMPFWTGYILWFSRRAQPVAKAAMEAGDRNVSLITENIAGVHVVKAFATEKTEITRYNENSDEFMARVLRRIRMHANFGPVIRGIGATSHLLMYLLGAILIIKSSGQQLGVGDLIVLSGAMGAILGRLQGVAGIAEQYQDAIVSARRLYEILAAPPTVPEDPNATPLPPGGGKVVFDRISFGYNPDKPVLRDIDLTVPAGSVVAIVGPTGAGKSTLVSLVARFYDPSSGSISIDDADLRKTTLDSLRTQVSFVFQETYLFSATVSQNIAYGKPDVTHGQIEAAARFAQAHEFIEKLPKGYDEMLGERGTNLSGGQRQRLAIARAIVTNPRVLILDDATASVDPETEDLIRRGMRFVMLGRTTFVIAHRISTVQRADMVIVIEQGRITQRGTHKQLMSVPGYYRDVAITQLDPDEPHSTDDAQTNPRVPADESPSHIKRLRDEQAVTAAQNQARRASRSGDDV